MAFLFLLSLLLVSTFLGTDAKVFSLENRCNATIWPAILARAGHPQINQHELYLNPGQTVAIGTPTSWVGQVWARTGCSFDQAGKMLNCTTGYCGGGMEECGRPNTVPLPTTVADFLLDDSLDYYYISLVDGFNIPLSVVPSAGSGDCEPVKCLSDLNLHCPHKLQVKSKGRVVGCKSACMAFDKPEYCCTGAYGDRDTCKASGYSQFFKDSCPAAFTYSQDDLSSAVITCKAADYWISFC